MNAIAAVPLTEKPPEPQREAPTLPRLRPGDLREHVQCEFVRRVPEAHNLTREQLQDRDFMSQYIGAANGDVLKPLSEVVLYGHDVRWRARFTVLNCGAGWAHVHLDEYVDLPAPRVAEHQLVPANYKVERDSFSSKWHVTYIPTGVCLNPDGARDFEEARGIAVHHAARVAK